MEPDNFNPEAAGGFNETPDQEQPDLRVVVEAIVNDAELLQVLADALKPLMAQEEATEEPAEGFVPEGEGTEDLA